MAGWNAITGARGIVAAFTMSILLQLGIADVTTGLLLCSVVSAVGVVLYARASTEAVLELPAHGSRLARATRAAHGVRTAVRGSRAA
jgi:hypothetical protein